MKRSLLALVAILMTGLALQLAACDSGKETGTPDTEADTDTDADTDSDTDADTDADSDPILDTDHLGWEQPACWDCHDSASTHNPKMDPYECASCHGDNGASAGHGSAGPCLGCHPEVLTSHGKDGFPDPESCLVCHP